LWVGGVWGGGGREGAPPPAASLCCAHEKIKVYNLIEI